MTLPITAVAAAMCLCGDPDVRHRVGVRAGTPVRTSCKDCGCDSFECADPAAAVAAAAASPVEGDRPVRMPNSPVGAPEQAAPHSSAPPPSATRSGRGTAVAVLAPVRRTPGPDGPEPGDRSGHQALAATTSGASPLTARVPQSPSRSPLGRRDVTATLAERPAAVRRRPAPGELIVTSSLMTIPIEWVQPGPNARGEDVGDVSDLVESLKATKQTTPIIVCQLDEHRFEVIEGHRRRKAILQAGLSHVDAVLRPRPNDQDRLIVQLTMHTHAKPFDPIAEARAVHELYWQHKLTRDQIARRLGRAPGWVRDRLALLNLTDEQQAAVASGTLPLRDAMGLVRTRRAIRDGKPVPQPSTAAATTRRGRSQTDDHFTGGHPLAEAARRRCQAIDEHAQLARLGGVACGKCWEHAIRTDQASVPALVEDVA